MSSSRPEGLAWDADAVFIGTLEAAPQATMAARLQEHTLILEALLEEEREANQSKEILLHDGGADSVIIEPSNGSTPPLVGPTAVEEPTASTYSALVEQLGDLNSEASLNARLGFRSRFFVTFICPDTIGVLYRLTQGLAEANCNVEGATMVVVAGQFATMMIVSGLNGLDQDSLTSRLESLPSEVIGSSELLPPPPHVFAVRTVDPEWPLPDSENWNLYSEVPDAPGILADVSSIIAEYNVPLIAFSTWKTVDNRFVLDLNFAVSPVNQIERLVERLEQRLTELDASSTQIQQTTRPLHSARIGHSPPHAGRSVVLTVIGRAEPGLVSAVTRGLVEGHDGVHFTILGSAMAILDGHTGMTLVVEPDANLPAHEVVSRSGLAAMSKTKRFEAVVANAYVLQDDGASIAAPPSTATHRIRVETPEEVGVLREYSETASLYGANVVWLFARVVERTDSGVVAERCEINMDFAVPEQHVTDLHNALSELSKSRHWDFTWSTVPVFEVAQTEG